jgi:tetratricopeptide (TPR) repeat protein
MSVKFGKGKQMSEKSYPFLLAVFLWLPLGAAAQMLPWTPTDEEFQSLPDYCRVKMKTDWNGPEVRDWVSRVGKDFVHVHHYCAGMNFANRSFRLRSPQDRKYFRGKAYTNYEYMITHADPSFGLMPDVYVSRGQLYMADQQPSQALADYKKALELRPDFVTAHLAIVDWYKRAKQNEAALAAATEGLRQVPESKALQKRYLDLGGVEPFPEPVRKQEAPVDQGAQLAQESGVPDSTQVKATDKTDQPLNSSQEGALGIGVPGNPWCRFCPEPATK